ncbi:MAG: pilus assembly protein PilY [Gammaproteobacteria bacterium]|nr:pilus assembly protein PilY [Gammaproteobacteria bacterium]MBU6508935.1 pilus assembly protein PilY [Gammaproteobacteria bacterium]MDE1983634.1 pilus assembly protein PilY [Gammaproteobacteria bacterium]MDE2108812.1 pilus assembly protein PilY [Gammaproteobacteria bacterium]MDE2460384.1 pilus assembly protein PilY [Gammaproteobacteria bacterium]
MNTKLRHLKNGLLISGVATLASVTFSIVPVSMPQAVAAPSVSISSTPLNVIIPSTPEVMIALTNSNSMDSSDNIIDDANSTLSIPAATTHGRAPSSAIMTWSGANGWPANSSPVNYQVPAGYTAPITGISAGSTLYTAPINTYTIFGVGGHYWWCAVSKDPTTIDPITGLNWTAIPNPTSDPPINFSSPNPAPVPWDNTQTWWFNNDGGPGNGYYEQVGPPPLGASVNKVPSARELFHGEAAEYALNGNAGLLSVGMGNGPGGKPKPRVGGGGGGGPPCCGPPPPPPPVCVLYKWIPGFPTSTNKTPIGDNSASRLNVAKESIAQVIQTYGTQVDFGLMAYQYKSGWASSYTWAYYMSPAGGFTAADFSNVYVAPSAAGEWVINPCFGINPAGNCGNLVSQIGGGMTLAQLQSYRYMLVAKSGDDPDVDDVLLAGWANNYRFMTYGTITAPTLVPPANSNPIATPYSPVGPFTLANYNQGEPASCSISGSNCVQMQYSATAPTIPWNGTYTLQPTNSGYVPYSQQVFFTLRGYLWSGNAFSNQGSVKLPVFAPAGTTAAPQAAYLQQFTTYLTPENNVQSDDTGIIPSSNPAISYYNYYKNALFSFATQSPIAGLLSSALSPSAWMPPPPPGVCNPAKYVVLITDGLPTMDLSGNSWPPPGSAAAAGYGSTVAFNGDGTLNAAGTNNQAVIDTINQITALNVAGIKTFVVGMGGGVDPTLNPEAAKVLNAMAIAGGTKNYYPGTSPAAVVSQLNAILTIIASTTVASVSGAVSSYSLPGANVYQATYTGYDKPDQDWTGNLQAFPVLPNGNASIAPLWSAQTQLDTQNWDTGRLIVTCGTTPGGGCAPGSGIPFRWTAMTPWMRMALKLPSDPGMSLVKDRINYLRGDTSNYAPAGDGFRPRSHVLGDIVDSATLYVGPSNGPYTSDPSYRSFVTSTQSRAPTLYVGANDGMLHAFNALTGNEVFAFIPNGVFANLAKLSDPSYNNNHQFYVDGSPTAGDVKFNDNTWHTVLAGGLNDGGNSIYALDITAPPSAPPPPGLESTIANNVLWEFADPHMGLSYSEPAFAITNDIASTNANPNGFLLFFGSGYNNSDGNPYLYAVNPQTGQIVSKDVSQVGQPLGAINLCNAPGVPAGACNPALPNGLSGVTVINNVGVIGAPATTVYAGDLQGNLWKVDISNADPKNWVVTLLFQARDSLGNPQPITDTPVVTLSPAFPSAPGTVVYFGTGQYLGTPDITDVHTQSFYAVLDNNTGTPLARTNLVQQTLSSTSEIINGNNVTLRTVTNNTVNWSTQYGWYMDLPIPGERVVTNPRIFSGEVVFTTFVPSPAALCAGGGQSFLMVLNYNNGGAFPTPQLDINGDGLLNGSDQVAGQNPVGLSLGNVFASAPDILSANLGSIKAVKLTTISTPNGQSNGNIVSLGEAGGTPAKLTWTQLQ